MLTTSYVSVRRVTSIASGERTGVPFQELLGCFIRTVPTRLATRGMSPWLLSAKPGCSRSFNGQVGKKEVCSQCFLFIGGFVSRFYMPGAFFLTIHWINRNAYGDTKRFCPFGVKFIEEVRTLCALERTFLDEKLA
ncbi:hypothetical protein XU18_2086 [Perkinsela sp. CCAP 1560/4]|nr:hypothetical protein XU18_2086 [Perkinsela sp. CCAP 1560/4]|eukprot:KNH07223.1 hypothetical protein XU18_2086 [Perkinsela sp. CCAP 1560/4]